LLWEAIHVAPELKDRLLSQALLTFTVRSKVDRARVPLHGIILLAGLPGTGKTSLAKGLADRVAQILPKASLAYLEVEPHSLQSSALGKSQKAVTELFAITIAERAAQGPTFVLLDEVETLVVDRSKLSMDANPCRIERRPPRLDLQNWPHLPLPRVRTTAAADYMTLLAGISTSPAPSDMEVA